MTSARTQPLCKNYNTNIVYYDGFRVCPRNITEENTALKILNIQFCLIWTSEVISSNNAIKEIGDNLKFLIKLNLTNMLKDLSDTNTNLKKFNPN